MPGDNKWRTLDLMTRSIAARKITVRTIKARARKVLELVKKCAAGAPDVLDGDGLERTVDTPESKGLLRKAGAESIVLLRNENGILPLSPAKLKKVAILGPNAKAIVLSGGGSAALKASFFVSPYEGIVKALKEAGTEVVYSEGARGASSHSCLYYDVPLTRNWNTQRTKPPRRSTTRCSPLTDGAGGLARGTGTPAMTASK